MLKNSFAVIMSALLLALMLVASTVGIAGANDDPVPSYKWYLNESKDPVTEDYMLTDGVGSSADVLVPGTGYLGGGYNYQYWSVLLESGMAIPEGTSMSVKLAVPVQWYEEELGTTCNAVLGSYHANSDTFTPFAVNSHPLEHSCYWDCTYTFNFEASTYNEVPPGHYLALQITNIGSCSRHVITNSDSYVTISGYGVTAPIPEFSTFVLLGMGMLLLAGYMVFKRKRQRVGAVVGS